MDRKAPPDPLSIGEIAARWRMSKQTVTRMANAGTFPNAFRVGRIWRIPASDVEAYEQQEMGE